MPLLPSEGFDDALSCAELTPERIWDAIRRLLAARPASKHSGITAHELVETLLGGVAAEGPAAWRARQAFKARLVERLATMPGLTYVEGDA